MSNFFAQYPSVNGLGAAGSTATVNSKGEQLVAIGDPVTGAIANVTAFHNTDNQVFGATTNGLFTGGVAQILNPTGGLDRQRETSTDNIPAVGIATGTQQLASFYTTNIVASIVASASAQTVTPVTMGGSVNGSPYAIKVGSILTIDNSPTQENVVVTAVTATTFTAIFTLSHTGPVFVTGFTYNQARDASVGNNVVSTGLTSEVSYGQFNTTLPTISSGNYASMQVDVNGRLIVAPVTANIGTTNGLALDTSVNSLLKPASTLAAVTAITNTVTVKADTPANQINAFKVDGTATVQPISASALPLPTGASTSSLQTSANASLTSIDSKLTTPLATKAAGKTSAMVPVRNDYTVTPVTSAAFVQLIASAAATTEIEIFDSSGQPLSLAFGAAGSEVIQATIFPGGNGRIPLAIPAGTRVSIKAISASAIAGELDLNFYA